MGCMIPSADPFVIDVLTQMEFIETNLDTDQIEEFARIFTVHTIDAGNYVYNVGDSATDFYIIGLYP